MKRFLLSAMVVMAAFPAMAMKVTNLDTIAHRVEFVAAGSRDVRDIAPAATESFVAQPGGILSLLTSPATKSSGGMLQADGLLSGIIGAGRTSQIPADPDCHYVIWPGGKIGLQRRMGAARDRR